MTIDEIIEYVLHTPHNINKAILRQMLQELIDSNDSSTPSKIIYDGGVEK